MPVGVYQRAPKFGVGINDIGEIYDPITGKQTRFFSLWNHMLCRCFSPVFKKKNPAYIEVTCVEEWKYFSNFKTWVETQDWEGIHLDKDILLIGNKVYGPDTCVFVPQWLNSLMLSRDSDRGPYPLGVHFNKLNRNYYARISKFGKRVHIGVYDNPNEAHKMWQLAKVEYIHESINRYIAEKDLQNKFADNRIIKALKERADMIHYEFKNNLITEKA